MDSVSKMINNDKLLAQYSAERAARIMYEAKKQFARQNQNRNTPEFGELVEGGYIDAAAQTLGYGTWTIGRGKLPNGERVPSPRTYLRPHKPNGHQETYNQQARTLSDILDQILPTVLGKSQGPHDNAIHHVSILISGKADTGKTTLVESILEATIARYGKDHVVGLRSSRDLPALFENLDSATEQHPHAIVLFADDMDKSIAKLVGSLSIRGKTDALDNFNGEITEKENARAHWLDKVYDIRGELFRRGLREGLVIFVASVHRFFAMPLDMRTDCDCVLFRSTGTPGTFDSRMIQKMLGGPSFDELRMHERRTLKDRTEMDWTGYVLKDGSGIVKVPRAEDWLMQTVHSKSVSRKRPSKLVEIASGLFILGLCGAMLLWILG